MSSFETIGNATLIVYEGKENPILATDVWLDEDKAYFGSWCLSHEVPQRQRDALKKVSYIFISHFHPDHLNLNSLKYFKQSTILIAQHFGARVEKDLRSAGFKVINLPSRKWISIGKKTRIILFNNEIQDSSILVEMADNSDTKSLILNLNDSMGLGNINEISKISSKYKNSFYLAFSGYGDADMINLFDNNGKRIEPFAARKEPVGPSFKSQMSKFNCNVAIPFSSFHQYVRRDSFWANKYTTPLSAYSELFEPDINSQLLPAFQQVYLSDGSYKAINLNPKEIIFNEPIHESKFGDNWDEKMSSREFKQCKEYFESIELLRYNFKSILLSVGGIENYVIKNGSGNAIIKFEVPRNSLLKAIRREIFDDLLIGNFMRTHLTNCKSLYDPDFTLTSTKYSDNGGIKSQEELKEYFAYYNDKDRKSFMDRLVAKKKIFKSYIKTNVPKSIYSLLKYLLKRE